MSSRPASSSPSVSSSVVAAARIEVSGVRNSWVRESISAVRSRSPSRAASMRAEVSMAMERATAIATCGADRRCNLARKRMPAARPARPPAAAPASASWCGSRQAAPASGSGPASWPACWSGRWPAPRPSRHRTGPDRRRREPRHPASKMRSISRGRSRISPSASSWSIISWLSA